MNNHIVHIEVPEGRLKEILDKMTEAQTTIYQCWEELEHLGIVVIKKAPLRQGEGAGVHRRFGRTGGACRADKDPAGADARRGGAWRGGVREDRMEELIFRIKTSGYDEQHIQAMIKRISAAYSGNCKLRIEVEIDERWMPTPARWDHPEDARRVPYK